MKISEEKGIQFGSVENLPQMAADDGEESKLEDPELKQIFSKIPAETHARAVSADEQGYKECSLRDLLDTVNNVVKNQQCRSAGPLNTKGKTLVYSKSFSNTLKMYVNDIKAIHVFKVPTRQFITHSDTSDLQNCGLKESARLKHSWLNKPVS
uniref:Uncharacterized protein n=1 Tax=Marmota marmota marmota TaxID=9994 RepID=A0A8C5ZR58_MARMA